jgi:tetratricopeptide (TPR) repeat protein
MVDPFNIPFSRQGIPVDNFVGRKEQLQHIEQQLQPALLAEKSRRTVVVIRGLGGIGKTKLAANYAQLHQDGYSAIFWMDGSTRDSLGQSFVKAAERIPKGQLQGDPTAVQENGQIDVQRVMASVLLWLSLPGNWKWLLVIDNVDREFQEPGKDEQGFNPEEAMPSSDHGSMLITSRLWSVKGTGKDLDLDRVNENEAQAILTRHAGRNITDSHLLLQKLDGLPLALAQAGSFVGLSNIGVKEYIQYFDETWSDLMQNQDRFPSQDYQRSMLTTWKISYDQVLRRSETAAWLLRLWAFFYHDDFWYGLFTNSDRFLQVLGNGEKFEMPTWLAELARSELGFSSAMALLKAYSLAESTGGRSYTMHAVLHRWSRSLSLDTDAAPLIYISICLLASATPSSEDIMSWKLQRRLLQHVLHACNELNVTRTPAQQELPSRATSRLGTLFRHQDKLNDAEQMYLRALPAKEKALGPNHKSTLATVNNLGTLYWKQGKLDEAKQMFQRALLGNENELGPNHKSTLGNVNNLGTLYWKQGKIEEAEQMYKRALLGSERKLGPNHTSTLGTVSNLGIVYAEQGKLDEAEQMFQRALTSYEKTYGTEDLTLLNAVYHLGNLYRHQGRLDEAEKMIRRSLAGYEKMHGKKALTLPLLDSVFVLGLVYYDQGRLDEAEQNLESALAGYQEVHGRPHERLEDVSKNLALVRADIGELPPSAISLYQLTVSPSCPRCRVTICSNLLTCRE